MKTILALFIGALFGYAVADLHEAMQDVEVATPRPAVYTPVSHTMLEEMSAEDRDKSTCYPLAPRGETYSVVLPAGVTCITVMGVTR